VGLKPISVADWLPSAVGWVTCPVKIVPEITYKVSSGTLSLYSLLIITKLRSTLFRLVAEQQIGLVSIMHVKTRDALEVK